MLSETQAECEICGLTDHDAFYDHPDALHSSKKYYCARHHHGFHGECPSHLREQLRDLLVENNKSLAENNQLMAKYLLVITGQRYDGPPTETHKPLIQTADVEEAPPK